MSKIEQIISEIEEYIDNCKFQPLSSTKIIVNKDEMDELLSELKLKTPDEIKKYQKIIENKDAILKDAKLKAEAMIAEANKKTTTLVSEHEIMQQAYVQANEVIKNANDKAEEIINNAVAEANAYKEAASEYLDSMLASIQSLLTQTIQDTNARSVALIEASNAYHQEYIKTTKNGHDSVVEGLEKTLETVILNREQLIGPQETQESAEVGAEAIADELEDYTVNLDEE